MFANASMINESITLQLHEQYPLCIQCNLKDDGFIKDYHLKLLINLYWMKSQHKIILIKKVKTKLTHHSN